MFNFYSMEVVQRIGYDSFTPDNGVLIAKNKDKETDSCGYNCFTWVIDAHPEDIGRLDFKRPHGEPVMRSIADYRQLNDALFHAGLNSGSQYEWEDTANRLHFYVIDVHRDERGILTYQLGVRSLDGSGLQTRGISLAPGAESSEGRYKRCTFVLTNTGSAESSSIADKQLAKYFVSDIYRLSAQTGNPSWTAQLRNALVAIKAGESATAGVYVADRGNGGRSTVTLKAQSESDPSKVSTSTCSIEP